MKITTGIDFRPPALPRLPAIQDIRRQLEQRTREQNHADVDRSARQAGLLMEERRPWLPDMSDAHVQEWIDGGWK